MRKQSFNNCKKEIRIALELEKTVFDSGFYSEKAKYLKKYGSKSIDQMRLEPWYRAYWNI